MATKELKEPPEHLATWWIGGIVILFVLFGIMASKNGATGTSQSNGPNANTLACLHWSNVRGDVTSGVLTASELRAKVAEVRGSASTNAVEDAATKLLGGLTSGDSAQISSGTKALNAACK